MSVTIQLTSEAVALLKRMKDLPQSMQQAIAAAMDAQNDLTVGHIQEARMSGHGPFPPSQGRLGVVHNHLRRSLRRSRAVILGNRVESAIGSNIRYAGVHEFGFDGPVQVASFQRRLSRTQAGTATMDDSGRIKRGKPRKISAGVVTVRAFTRNMKMPARAPISRGIDDRRVEYAVAVSEAIVNAFRGARS